MKTQRSQAVRKIFAFASCKVWAILSSVLSTGDKGVLPYGYGRIPRNVCRQLSCFTLRLLSALSSRVSTLVSDIIAGRHECTRLEPSRKLPTSAPSLAYPRCMGKNTTRETRNRLLNLSICLGYPLSLHELGTIVPTRTLFSARANPPHLAGVSLWHPFRSLSAFESFASSASSTASFLLSAAPPVSM
jgi:hypothetical protein